MRDQFPRRAKWRQPRAHPHHAMAELAQLPAACHDAAENAQQSGLVDWF